MTRTAVGILQGHDVYVYARRARYLEFKNAKN